MPSDRHVRELQNRGLKLDGFAEQDNSSILGGPIGRTEELPLAVLVMDCVQNRLGSVEHLSCDEGHAIARFSKWPTISARHLTRKSWAAAGGSERGWD